MVKRRESHKRAGEAIKEEAGGGLTVKTRQHSGVYPRTSLTVFRLRRLRRWGSTRKKSAPTGFRWRDMRINRFEFSDSSRPSKLLEQKITLQSKAKKNSVKIFFFFEKAILCYFYCAREYFILWIFSSHSVGIFSFTSCLGTHSATIIKEKPCNGHFAVRVLTEF